MTLNLRRIGCGALLGCIAALSGCGDRGATGADAEEPAGSGVFAGITMPRLEGGQMTLDELDGRVVVIANTASQCGYVDEFAGLQKLHERYADQGLTVIGVPSADFGGQEFDEAERIQQFCQENYGVSFAMLARTHVSGEDQVELFRRLTDPANDPDELGEIRWNFEKFVIDRQGRLIARFRSDEPADSDEVVATVERALETAG